MSDMACTAARPVEVCHPANTHAGLVHCTQLNAMVHACMGYLRLVGTVFRNMYDKWTQGGWLCFVLRRPTTVRPGLPYRTYLAFRFRSLREDLPTLQHWTSCCNDTGQRGSTGWGRSCGDTSSGYRGHLFTAWETNVGT